ncbi:phosphatidate cytidylyltransferase [Aeromonas diversa CDC 2478-85]|uniref:Phosphatidate cytidylyltransferase n=1 Tax=Aeromonas diversa CDC 2478-85 TaxID=1268237 RepID=N9VMC5_9GAMM|nr:phosphatidate cytidylyltransferase [Aeromonas diversa]ENY72521.1 phosphatidate cytidylyltransferase [Aeromonas diversa CDC 2478-85]
MLKQRIITALLLIPLVFGALFFLPIKWFALLLAGVFVLASQEWGAFVDARLRHPVSLLLCVLLGLTLLWQPVDRLWSPDLASLPTSMLYLSASWWLLALLLVVRYPGSAALWRHSRWLKTLFGAATLIPFFWALLSLRSVNIWHDSATGAWLLLFVMGLVWAADSGAYFCGRAFGKRKLAPAVSPGKTLEGMLGGLLCSAGLAVTVAWWQDADSQRTLVVLLSSLLAVLASVLGDLSESMFKREAGLKDSGALLPGHGGVLDRIDSLTAALPVFLLSYLLLS